MMSRLENFSSYGPAECRCTSKSAEIHFFFVTRLSLFTYVLRPLSLNLLRSSAKVSSFVLDRTECGLNRPSVESGPLSLRTADFQDVSFFDIPACTAKS